MSNTFSFCFISSWILIPSRVRLFLLGDKILIRMGLELKMWLPILVTPWKTWTSYYNLLVMSVVHYLIGIFDGLGGLVTFKFPENLFATSLLKHRRFRGGQLISRGWEGCRRNADKVPTVYMSLLLPLFHLFPKPKYTSNMVFHSFSCKI